MNKLNDREAIQFLGILFPNGLRDVELLAELCPEGWQASPLSLIFHPSAERTYEEHLRFTRNLNSLFRKRNKPKTPPEPEPSFEEFLASHPQKPWQPSEQDLIEEPAELLGLCLWDIFSDNHEVITREGNIVDLGSFRGSAGAIAEFFDRSEQNCSDHDWWSEGDYMRFYMGTALISGRGDLTPIYRLIFQRLKSLGADWRYAFPRIHLIDFGSAKPAPENYDPSAAVAAEIEQAQRDAETQRMRKRLDQSVRADKRAARANTPPATVRAYQEIFGHFPKGWPPDPYSAD